MWLASGCTLAANGAVMRTAIAAVPQYASLEDAVEDCVGFARATHYDPRAVASCVAVAAAVSEMLKRAASAPEDGAVRASGRPSSPFIMSVLQNKCARLPARFLPADDTSGQLLLWSRRFHSHFSCLVVCACRRRARPSCPTMPSRVWWS